MIGEILSMKKFVLYTVAILALLAAVFMYILYSEGAFDAYITSDQEKVQPFMKCEAGKCAPGKCGANP